MTWCVARTQILPNLKCEKARGQNCARWRLLSNRKLETPIHAPKRAAMRGMACHAHADQLVAPSKPPDTFKTTPHVPTKDRTVFTKHTLLLPPLRARRRMRAPKTDRKLNRAPTPFSSCQTTTPSGLPQTNGNNEPGTPYCWEALSG